MSDDPEYEVCPKCGFWFSHERYRHPNFEDHDCKCYRRWMRDLKNVSKPIGRCVYSGANNVSVFRVETKYGARLLTHMLHQVLHIDFSWMYPDPKQYAVYMICVGTEAVGYLVWWKKNTLSQIFIRPEFQRKGHGLTLLKASSQDLGFDIRKDEWFVDSPEESFCCFLIKYGVVEEMSNGDLIGKNIKFLIPRG